MKQPLTNPFGIPDPALEKKPVRASPFDMPQQQQQQPWDDLSGTISLQEQEEETFNLVETTDKQNQHHDDDEDIPFLEELDITSPILIKSRIIDILLFRKPDDDYIRDPDLSGPIILMLALGICLMLQGKIHFNYLYGFGLCGWLGVYFLMNSMNQSDKLIEFYKVLSYLGYGLTPIVIISVLNIFLDLNAIFGYIIGALAMLWATLSVSKTFDQLIALDHRRLLIAYPLFLFYGTFILITIF